MPEEVYTPVVSKLTKARAVHEVETAPWVTPVYVGHMWHCLTRHETAMIDKGNTMTN